MHEFGIRILIRKVQLIGAQHDKALVPVFCYAKEHYMKIFFRCATGKTRVDEVLKQQETIKIQDKKYGPIWTGKLWDSELVEQMMKSSEKLDVSKETKKLLSSINDEKDIPSIFFHDVHKLSQKKKTGDTPRFEKIIENLRKKGFLASRTHFSLTGIRTNATDVEFSKVFDEEMKSTNN
jgi:tRNA (guanine26-N2/guanine27-N2)-dimethyltransferase